MTDRPYLMESPDELERLEMKTDGRQVVEQARWAGIRPGQRVADLGCGGGKTSVHLWRLVQPGGSVVAVDQSPERVGHAERSYGRAGLRFVCRDCRQSLDDLGRFDFVWIRFLLEFEAAEASTIVRRAHEVLAPGGLLCLVDLDHNCLNHHPLPPPLARALAGVMDELARRTGFDPYAGRKLYGHLYDLGMEDIRLDLRADRLIYGPLQESDRFNWRQKMLLAAHGSGYDFFRDFPDGAEGFIEAFLRFFEDPRRFTYNPMILCCGRRAAAPASL